MTKQPSVRSFIRRGILPDDVPPIFSTAEMVAPCLADVTTYQVTKDVSGRASPYNGSKRGFQRRAFGVPHPVFARDAAVFFKKHWTAIESVFARATESASTPIFEETRARALRITPHSKLPALRLKSLARYKYCLVTDVSRCFPSIYTHSIPWALNGKAEAKKDRKATSAKVFGNRLDFIVRQAQDGQTMGLPVGPDHSRVIAELILSSIDEIYREHRKLGSYLRHVDDIWIGHDSRAECEESLHHLRRALNEYSLDINELKTRIVRTSAIVSERWPYELEAQLEAALDLDPVSYEARIVSLLGSIIEMASADQDDGIIKFFIRKIDNWEKWDEYWNLLEPFLAHCAVQYPHCFDYVAQVVTWRVRTGRDYDEGLWGDVARKTIRGSAAAGRDSEAAWSLWLAKELGIKLSSATFSALAAGTSPLVGALLVEFSTRGKVQGKHSVAELWNRIEGSVLSGSAWPLALQLWHADVKPPATITVDGADPLKCIFDVKASIIDWDALPPAFITENDEVNENPAGALGSGSGYDSDDEDGDDIDLDNLPF